MLRGLREGRGFHAALLYQHKSCKADRMIADGLDALVEADQDNDDGDDGPAGTLVPVA